MADQPVIQRKQWLVVRLLGIGLAVTLLSLSGFGIWAIGQTQQAIAGAKRANDLNNAFDEARFQLATEEVELLEYRLESTATARLEYQQAGIAFVQALQPVFSVGDSTDSTVARELLGLHQRYLDAAAEMLNAVDAGDGQRAAGLAQQKVQPIFTEVELRAQQEEALEALETHKDLASADQTGRWLQQTAPFLFGIGLLLVGIFALVSRSYRRRIQAGERRAGLAEIERIRIVAEGEQQLLRRSQERFRALIQYAADLITVVGIDGTILFQSDSSMRLLDYDPAATVGKSLFDFVVPDDVAKVKGFLAAALRKPGHPVAGEIRARRRDGTAIPVETIGTSLIDNPNVGGILLTSRDLTERKAFQDRLEQQALHDALTGLPNRVLFADRVTHALARSGRNRDLVAVLFLDLDDFKLVNDSFGHKAGDSLLQAVAREIQTGLRPGDTVARLGGDEFTILLEGLRQAGEAELIAERIAAELKQPVILDGRPVVPSASIGIATSSNGDGAADDLLRNADVAMYAAKSEGKSRWVMFDESMKTLAWERMALELDLRRALTQGEFRVFYQPIVDLGSGRVREVEALIRWQHPDRGLLPPSAFMTLAESTGMIVPMGGWVLREACRQLRAWQDLYGELAPGRVCVNLAARQFQQAKLVEQVETILRETGLGPTALTLEITETVMMQDPEGARKLLNELRDLGVQIAVDDFGTGYSSLNYLRQFPIDVLKIDRSFVTGLNENVQNTAIVRAVVSLAKTLNLKVVGEGIEEADQATTLRDLGCELGQGYLFAKPLSPDKVVDLFQAGQSERLVA